MPQTPRRGIVTSVPIPLRLVPYDPRRITRPPRISMSSEGT